MTAYTVTWLFAALLFVNVALKLFLSWRHIRHIHQNRAMVPNDFVDGMPLATHQKAADYAITKTRFSTFQSLFAALVLLGFTLFGGLDWLNQHLQWFSAPILNGLFLILVFAAIQSILDLPFEHYSQFVIEARFGFNKMTERLFWQDSLKALVVGAVVGIPLLLAVLWLLEVAGSGWWFYAWLLWTTFTLLMMVIYPSVIAPWFNKFTPLEDAGLQQRINSLLDRCGFRSSGVFVMNGSLRSAHGNAYFTGLGKSKRIVFFDTLLRLLNPSEIEAVLAHELGHFKLRHILRRLISSIVFSFLLLFLLAYLMEQDWFYLGLGVESSGNRDALALLLFAMVLPLFAFVLQPFLSATSRRHEFEADRFAAQNAGGGDLITALVKMYQDNAATLTPDPLYVRFYYSHPPAVARIAALRLAQGAPLAS